VPARPAVLRLDPMTPEELDRWLAHAIPAYAEDHVRAGRWDAANALELSRAEHARLIPQGVATPDQFLRTLRDAASGQVVGELWYALRKEGARTDLFVYWIGIAEAHRRRGYAREALRALEPEAKRLGADRIALHVFGENTGAQALYRSLGYEVTNLLMAKPV
jgi:ribosomal protein S18 acetylase RimI-like enzyme